LDTLAETDKIRILKEMEENPELTVQQSLQNQIKFWHEDEANKQRRCQKLKVLVK
jgi:hypothetical protein